MEELLVYKAYREAAKKCVALLALPLPESDMVGIGDTFDPWELFPALLGSYSPDFDELAIEVLKSMHTGYRCGQRNDLASEMFREMLCTSNLCDYGSSPRACFPTEEFKVLLPSLIEKWILYSQIAWG